MKIKPWFLFLTLCLGILFHAGGLTWLNHLPIGFLQPYNNTIDSTYLSCDILQRKQRTEILTEIFEQLTDEQSEVKVAPHELRAECAPKLDVKFPGVVFDLMPDAEGIFEKYRSNLSRDDSKNLIDSENPLSMYSKLTSSVPLIDLSTLVDSVFINDPFSDLGTLASSEHFDIQLEYAPKRSRPGYVFKITLLPHNDVQFKKIRQNFYFLIDRSNSIPRTRYSLNKKAVMDALQFLKKGDRFNILVFDDHVVHFKQREVDWSEETMAEAKFFLDNQGHGGYFAATELYASLGKIIPHNVAEDEINTAILLSDGDTYLTQEKQRLTIGKWTAQNKGKVALYTVASGTGNNLPLLELLSSFNKGALIYTQEHHDLVSRLGYLMRTLQHPIGKQIVVTALAEDKSMTIMLQPKASRIPDLYQHRPFVIYGTTNKLSDFVLFLQGRYYNQYFDIKKRISFNQARLGSFSVERGWTQLLVQEFYERYFEEGNLTHLEMAKQLLLPLNLPTPLIE